MTRKPKPSGRRLSSKGQSLGRRPVQSRELRPRFLIVCEGEQTEPNYFRSFRVNADIRIEGGRHNPQTTPETAERLRQEEDYTQVWIVFDRDEWRAEEFNQVIVQAGRKNIQVAYSNQAFELWYLLHFGYRDTAASRQDYRRLLSERLGHRYQKNDRSIYRSLLERQQQAIAHAQRLLDSYQPHNPAQDDPCTTVHRLVVELNRHII